MLARASHAAHRTPGIGSPRALASSLVAALAFVLLAYAAGSFLGAYTASTISLRHKRGVAVIVGMVMLALVSLNFWMIPHPTWMVIAGVLIPLPFALAGWKLAAR